MKATKIKMKSGCYNSTKTTEISKIYIEGCKNPGFFDKSVLHDYLQTNPHSIQVNISPYPDFNTSNQHKWRKICSFRTQ